jgi:hypothetical protein
MCAALQIGSRIFRPGKPLPFRSSKRTGTAAWAGFARAESLSWWLAQGAAPAEIPAHQFAERSDRTRQLRWEPVPAGTAVSGLFLENSGLLKILTRAASPEEYGRFEHPRMPVLAECAALQALFEIPVPPEPAETGDLFGGGLF